MYGVHETNPIPAGYHDVPIDREVYWTEPGLTITRLRLVTDPGHPVWDVSYCHGQIGSERVRVRLPFHQLPRRGRDRAIVDHAKRDRVYAKGLGVFEAISTLV